MRAVIDTNVFISAALFKGTTSRLVHAWKSRKFAYLISGEILKEYARVLSYPKFNLTESEIKFILEEQLLPFVETVRVKERTLNVLRDKDDEKFLNCAVQGHADTIVSGDEGILALGSYKKIKIISVSEFLTEKLKLQE